MRILMLAQFYPPIIGGEERHVKTLSEALAQRGHSVSVATLRHGNQPEVAVENGVTVHRIRSLVQRLPGLFAGDERQHAPPFFDPGAALAIRRIIDSTSPDIVHAHNWLLHSYLPLRRRRSPATIVTLHDYSLICPKKSMIRAGRPCDGPRLVKCLACSGDHYGALKGPVTALALRAGLRSTRKRVDRFIAVSRAVAELSDLSEGQDVEVIPNFIPDNLGQEDGTARFATHLGELPRGDFILFVGDLMRLKGMEPLLAAYTRLREAPPLVLIGRRCADMPVDLPPNTLVFESWPHGAVIEAWRRCLFGILPSVGLEACATVVMEANAMCRPMIVARTGGLPEIVEDGVSGLLVPPGDAVALQQAMERLLDDPGLRARLSEASRRKAETLMATAIVPRIEQVYGTVLRIQGSELIDDAGFSRGSVAGA